MLSAYDPFDLSKIYETSKLHKVALEQLIIDHGVEIKRFVDFEALAEYLKSI
jgi:hypothetical protein